MPLLSLSPPPSSPACCAVSARPLQLTTETYFVNRIPHHNELWWGWQMAMLSSARVSYDMYASRLERVKTQTTNFDIAIESGY